MTNIKRNIIFSIISIAFRTTALLCLTGTLMQTFLEALNISSKLNYIHTTVLQAANVTTILLCSGWTNTGSVFRKAALSQIPMGILFLMYIPFCISKGFASFALLLAIGVIQSVFAGLNTVCEYKIPYFIYRAEDYGLITSISGVLSAVITLGLSALISILSKYHEYKQIMLFAFVISSLLMITAGILNIYYKSLINMENIQNSRNSENKIKSSKVFCHPAFLHLLIPNIFRGFAYGTVTVLAIVAFDIGFDKSVTTMMVSVQTIATLAGCTVFGMSSKLIRPRSCILFGSLTFLLLPLMLIENKYVFLTVYAIIFFGRTIVDYAVPPYLLRVVPVEISGQYNAWRMILHNGGTLIATSVASVLPPIALFAVTIIFQLISGIGFMRFKAKN